MTRSQPWEKHSQRREQTARKPRGRTKVGAFQEQQGMVLWLVLGEPGWGREVKGRDADGEVGRARSHWTSGARGRCWGVSPVCDGSRAVVC